MQLLFHLVYYHSTCFGHGSCPSSGVIQKTVKAATSVCQCVWGEVVLSLVVCVRWIWVRYFKDARYHEHKKKLLYSWRGDYCKCVRPAQLPVLTEVRAPSLLEQHPWYVPHRDRAGYNTIVLSHNCLLNKQSTQRITNAWAWHDLILDRGNGIIVFNRRSKRCFRLTQWGIVSVSREKIVCVGTHLDSVWRMHGLYFRAVYKQSWHWVQLRLWVDFYVRVT